MSNNCHRYIAQAGLETAIFLFSLPHCCDYDIFLPNILQSKLIAQNELLVISNKDKPREQNFLVNSQTGQMVILLGQDSGGSFKSILFPTVVVCCFSLKYMRGNKK